MKAILLAAGIGSRTSNIFHGKPKCLAELETGLSLLKYTIRMLSTYNFNEIIIVVGYEKQFIEQEVRGLNNVRLINNPNFNTTNSLGSLLCANDYLDADCFIMNADVFLSGGLYTYISKTTHSTIFYDSSRVLEADYRFKIRDGKLINHGKNLSKEDTDGEYVGCCFINKSEINSFRSLLISMAKEGKTNKWWENILYDNPGAINYVLSDVKGMNWGEIDTLEDYLHVKKLYEEK